MVVLLHRFRQQTSRTSYAPINAHGRQVPNVAATSSSGKTEVDSCSGYRLKSLDERAPAGGRGNSGGASPLGGGKRRSLRRVVHHIRSMGESTRYVMTSFLLIPRRCSCRNLRRLAQINPKLRTRGAPLWRGRIATAPACAGSVHCRCASWENDVRRRDGRKNAASGRETLSRIIRQDCANQVLDVLERKRWLS
jgi:hypothetical protein